MVTYQYLPPQVFQNVERCLERRTEEGSDGLNTPLWNKGRF